MYNSALFHNRYKIIKKIGQGGMSRVFLCLDTHINKEWVVKMISVKDGLTRFANSEINLLKSLDYYMFPRIVDAFYEDSSIGIVTDYIKGESLDTYLNREGPIPVNIALNYFEDLLRALMYLHSQTPSILYLDMKPSNIMIKPDGSIRLIDFGIARSILIQGDCFGSIGYSPPEQYKQGKALNEKADVFSLAMTIYTMLTAREPKENLSEQRRIMSEEGIIPKSLKKILLACTEEDEKKRPTPNEVLVLLRGKSAEKRGIIPVLLVSTIVCFTSFVLFYTGSRIYKQREYENNRLKMIDEASRYMADGEYTKKGLSIIAGYVNGKLLDKETEETFTYDLAMDYFYKKNDYTNAQTYLKRLDKEKYPEIEKLIKVCEGMRGFSDSDEALAKLLIEEVGEKEVNKGSNQKNK